jgi:hypothetical protein
VSTFISSDFFWEVSALYGVFPVFIEEVGNPNPFMKNVYNNKDEHVKIGFSYYKYTSTK